MATNNPAVTWVLTHLNSPNVGTLNFSADDVTQETVALARNQSVQVDSLTNGMIKAEELKYIEITTLQNPAPPYPNEGGGSNIQLQNQGTDIGTAGQATTYNFTGSGVTASLSGDVATFLISGGGSGGSFPAFYENVFIQETDPALSIPSFDVPYMWVKIDSMNNVLDVLVGPIPFPVVSPMPGQNFFIQLLQPTATYPYLWVELDSMGNVVDILLGP